MHATGWSRGLEVTSGGTGIVSHAGPVLLRELADRTDLTAGLLATQRAPRAWSQPCSLSLERRIRLNTRT
jgi:hypothetical protein